jgi:ubiquinone/menaquinone biosynthesis C-methylase UbiE
MTDRRVTDYDAIADQYDRRYAVQTYDGIRDTIFSFLGSQPLAAILDVGCGTGHWLAAMRGCARIVAGVDLSGGMLARAHAAAPDAVLVRARAERPPFRDATFDRIVCVNALHHFADREAFFADARRLLKPGGGLLTIGLDPHANRDQWWVYDFFPEALVLDRARFAQVRILRGEMTKAGFAWAESVEAEHIASQRLQHEAFPKGIPRGFTSQFMMIDDEAFNGGVERLRDAGGDTWLVADLRLYATIGWVG